ncbi:MAG: zinc carboxypeptidase [Bacteroidetes bacterium]|nr:zinc carboxypeptidase [Bacteroidota bacterium]
MKKILLPFFIILRLTCVAQVTSPENFLGYSLGSRFTPYHNIVRYFEYIAQAAPSMVKLQQYGETNEHRPLYVAFVSSAENIGKLEQIRNNNLRLANLSPDKIAADENTPAIVWLSYNVHGNEPSSSEASMLTLYALVDPSNTQAKAWLKNTVVVIDPCLNPDGRDRYVNWFNSVSGDRYNANLQAREHREPWPGGRSNHYNFDLNRDWCWQRQTESRQRVQLYNQWLPQVHVDFHEQGVNEPYYFAPAAQPYHEVISQWQRDFQVAVGKNHAKYFDKNNWLYFTKEIFDLLYPSYGDTYPIYNGSIGMTYEQGGGPAGGIAALNNEGDTLTLHDRIMHHHTTGLSTIEISSVQNNGLIKAFHSFYNDAVAGSVGEYKTYIIQYNAADAERITALKELLDRNNIRYGNATGTGKGINYHTKKEETFSIHAEDLVISNAQPKAALIKVLFEPETKLVDSATYDITAWALPYAYGLTAYASKQAIKVTTGNTLSQFTSNAANDAYGYVIRWQGLASVKNVTQLLKRGIKLRYAQTAFISGDQSFNRGSILILKNGNERFGTSLWNSVAQVCNEQKVNMNAVQSGMVDKGFDFGSSTVHLLKAPRVMLLTGNGVNPNAAGEVWHFFEKELNYPITLVNAEDFGQLNLDNTDILILPDGRYNFINAKETAEKLHRWINEGGRVIAMENAAVQISKLDWSAVHVKNVSDSVTNADQPYASLQKFDNRERDALTQNTPGSIFKVDIDNTHPLMFGYPDYYYTLKMDNVLFDFMKEGGWNAGVLKKDKQLSGFVGSKLNSKFKDGLLFAVQEDGNGTVTYLADNVLFRDFWENGKLMFCNAVFLVGQ